MKRQIKLLGFLLTFVLLFAISQLASATLFHTLVGWSVAISEGLVFMLSYIVAMLLVVLLLRPIERLFDISKSEVLIGRRGFNPVLILRGVITLAAISVVLIPLSYIIPNDERTLPDSGWVLLTVGFIAPIFEEYIFRGRLYNMLGAMLQPSQAAVISSLIFGLVHLQPLVVIEGFVVGILLSYFYIKCRSIVAPIILHSLYNIVAYALITLSYQERELSALIDGNIAYLIVYIIASVIFIISFIRIFTKFHAENHRQQLISK